jgi:predicted RNA-binding protein associated with RNAse of E/G family
MTLKPQPQKVTEIKVRLDGRVDRFVCEVVERSRDHLVVLFRIHEEATVHGLRLPAGTLSLGHFWVDRPYNVYHWVAPDGTTLGLYANVGDVVRLDDREIEWQDLIVDVLGTPDGTVRVLDEDELPGDLDADLRLRIEIARDRLVDEMPALST